MPEDVSFPRFSRPRSSRPRSSRPVPGLSTNCYPRSPNWPGRTTLLQDPSAHVYSVLFLLVYISLVYISLVYISPLFLYLPRTLGLSLLLYSLSSMHRRPRPLASHEASANQGSRGKSPPNWIHLYPGTPAQHSRCLCLI